LPNPPLWVNPFLQMQSAFFGQVCQSDQTRGLKDRGCLVARNEGRIRLIGPFTRNGKTPERRSLKKKRVDAAYAPAFQDREALTTKRVKRMRYLRRPQRRVVEKCSSL
jgi:hypothetical protein